MASKPPIDSSVAWFEHLSSNPKIVLQVFCFPYAGGNSQMFRAWRRHFPSEVDVCLVHLPGRGRRLGEQPFTRLTAMVETIADRISGELGRPFAFYGHSMGASIAFELARELRRRRGILPAHLFLSGRHAPQESELSEPTTFDLPHDEFVTYLRKLNGTPRELLENPESLELFMPTLRADFEVVETYEYHPEEPLACPITVYGGVEDLEAPLEQMRGWQEHTSSAFRMRMFAGDHFFIQAPGVAFPEQFGHDVAAAVRQLMTSP